MRYSYQQLPYYCWFNSVPFLNENRSEASGALERSQDNLTNCPNIGDLASDFTLEGVFEGEKTSISLSEQKGRWQVIFFYASDFTFV